jgi:hypothetical protein
MEVVKKVKDLSIVKKRSGRYGVMDAKGKWVNGEEKVKVLLGAKLIKLAEAKKAPEPEVEAAPAEEVAATEAPAE